MCDVYCVCDVEIECVCGVIDDEVDLNGDWVDVFCVVF